MRTLVFLFVLSAGPPNTTIGQDRNYRGQHQDEKQEYNGFNWHRCHLPGRNLIAIKLYHPNRLQTPLITGATKARGNHSGADVLNASRAARIAVRQPACRASTSHGGMPGRCSRTGNHSRPGAAGSRPALPSGNARLALSGFNPQKKFIAPIARLFFENTDEK